jgi:septum formation protein
MGTDLVGESGRPVWQPPGGRVGFCSVSERLVLASGSPRRKALLEQVGLEVEVLPSQIDEAIREGEDPRTHVQRLAMEKAEDVARRCQEHWVIGADTVVVVDGRILGKPETSEAARAMLTALSGRDHGVFTGYAIVRRKEGIATGRVVETRVRVKALRPDEIGWYVRTGEPFGKAGGYAIQGVGCFMIEEIEGSYTNVVGLPVCQVLETLRTLGALEAR